MTSLKTCDWSGHIVGASASPRSLTKNVATSMSPSSTVHGGQHECKCKYVTLLLPSMECIRALFSVCFAFFFCEVAVGVGGSDERDQSAPTQTAPQQVGFAQTEIVV